MTPKAISRALAAIAAFAISSCSLQEQAGPGVNEVPAAKTLTVSFTTSDDETKAAFSGQDESTGKYPVSWTSSDKVISMSLNLAAPVGADVNKNAEVSRHADFTATFVDDGGPYTFYALSPVSASSTVSASRSSWTVNVPAVQIPAADGLSCDESAMVLYSVSEEVETLPEGPIELQFRHALTYCRLGLKNLDAALKANGADGAAVKSVDLTYSVPVSGSWYLDPADGTMTEKDASYTITLKPVIEDLSQQTDIWVAMVPRNLDGQTVKVSVNTDKGSLSREYTYGTRTYVAGAVNKLNLDMTRNASFDRYSVASEETVYQLVSSLGELNSNDEVIFVDAKTPAYAMTAVASGNNGIESVGRDAAFGFTYSSQDGYIRLPENSKVAVFTIGKSGSSMSFKTGNNYLSRTTSGSAHYLALTSTSFAFSVSVNAGTATLSYNSNSGKTTYSVYHGNVYYTIYASSSGAVRNCAIYRKTSVTNYHGIDPEDDPVCNQEQYGAYLASGNILHEPGTTQLSREWGTDLTFAMLYPGSQTVLEFKGIPLDAAKGDRFTLVLDRKVLGKETVLGTFEVTVVKEDGARLWLSDFSGNGFIIKR